MLGWIRPYIGPAAIIAIEQGMSFLNLGPNPIVAGLLLGFAGFWLVLAIFSNKALLRKVPWLLDWMPFLDPSGAFAPPRQLTGRYISGQAFRIPDLVAALSNSMQISDRTFEDCEIHGPAVLFPDGATQYLWCGFDAPPDTLVIRANQQRVLGVIRVLDCTFRKCRFYNVGFIGNEDLLRKMQEGLGADG